MISGLWTSALLVAAVCATACGGDAEVVETPPATMGTGGETAGNPTTGQGGGGATTTTGAGGAGGNGGSGGTPMSCEHSTVVSGEQTHNIDFEGRSREYDVQVPLTYDGSQPVPLVFDFHGFTSTKNQQELVSGFNDVAEDEGFIVVRPNGIGISRSWNGGDFCCGVAQSEDVDDVGLVKSIITEVSATACIDPKRIYATGISNGGALSQRLACEAADVIAAVAPVAYPIDRDPITQCAPSRPISVMHLHGVNDLLVPYNGSGTMQASPDSFAHWASVNGCTGTPATTYANDDSICETYETCGAGTQTSLCSIDGGHILYLNNDDVPIAALAWSFLSQHQLP